MVEVFSSVQVMQNMWRIRVFLPSSCPVEFHVDFCFEMGDDRFEQSLDQVCLDSDVPIFEEIHVQTFAPIE